MWVGLGQRDGLGEVPGTIPGDLGLTGIDTGRPSLGYSRYPSHSTLGWTLETAVFPSFPQRSFLLKSCMSC